MISISLIPIKKNNISNPDMKGILTDTEHCNESIPVIAYYLNDEQSTLSIIKDSKNNFLKSTEIKNICCLIELEAIKKNPNSNNNPDYINRIINRADYEGRIIEQKKTIDVMAWNEPSRGLIFPIRIKRKNKNNKNH